MAHLRLHIDEPRTEDEPFPFPGLRASDRTRRFSPRLVGSDGVGIGDEGRAWDAPSGRMTLDGAVAGRIDRGPGAFKPGASRPGAVHAAEQALADVERHLAALSGLVDAAIADDDHDDRPRAA